MEKRSFSGLHVAHLSNDNASSLFKSTIEIATPVSDQLSDIARAALDEFTTTSGEFAQQVNALQKSKYTLQINALDKTNDDVLAEIERTVVFMGKSRDAAKKAAADEFRFFLAPYWNVADKAIKTEADDLADMLAKYHADPNLMAAAVLIGVDNQMLELETSVAGVIRLYHLRNEETGNRKSGSELRPAAENSYKQFCKAFEQTLAFMQSDALITLFNSMDTLRRKYSALISEKAAPASTPKV